MTPDDRHSFSDPNPDKPEPKREKGDEGKLLKKERAVEGPSAGKREPDKRFLRQKRDKHMACSVAAFPRLDCSIKRSE
jgi:hypothetical protein